MFKSCPISIWLLALALIGLDGPTPALKGEDLSQLIDSMAGEKTPGLAVSVLQDGRVVFQRTRGMARMDQNSPITPDTQFYLCSLAKQFTSMAVAILEDRGRLKFAEPITNVLGNLPHFMDAITVDNLLRHTSGVADYLDEPVPPDTNERVLEYAQRSQKLLFPPGTDFQYSNTGYNILATAVVPVSGQPFPQFMKREIFGPLGMTSTLVCTGMKSLSTNRAVGYSSSKGQFNISDYTLRTFGDGGIFSTLNDMKSWCAAIETHRLLGTGKQEQLFKPTVLRGGREVTYARGWYVQDSPLGKYISHSGGLYGFRSQIAWCPGLKIWVIIFANRDDYDVGPPAMKIMKIQRAATLEAGGR